MNQSTNNQLCEQAALWVISNAPGIGRRRLNRLVAALQRARLPLREALGRPVVDLAEKVPALESTALAALHHGSDADLQEALRCLTALPSTIHILTILDSHYPALWKKYLREESPPFLFFQGNPELLTQPSGAVVGRRQVSPEGARLAGRCGERIVEKDWVLVSGGATGVDTAGHDAALALGKTSIAMLPQGIATYGLSPLWRHALEEGRLLLMSEYLPYTGWSTQAALARNKMIAAQARLVCVIEPRSSGGSIATARHALAQGKPILVSANVPLPADVEEAAFPIDLLQSHLDMELQGASPAKDYLEGLGDLE